MSTRIHQRLARERSGETGFVAVFLALSLTILLIFAAFTVDFGSWYTRSAELKRAADAAALAGVVWMPEFDTAQQYALEAAKKNGFENGKNNITVTVSQIANNNRQLQVTIRDTKAKQFFSRLVTQSQSIGRTSTAEYVLPVPLGSPENVFGTGNLSLANQPATQNFWAAVNGYCAGHESGDPKSAWWESYDTNGSGCNNGSAQNTDDYDTHGYLYAIDLPADATSMKLDVYDGSFNRSGSSMDNVLCSSCTESITTSYTVYDRNPNPLDTSDAKLATLAFSPVVVTTGQSGYQGSWVNLHTWSNPKAGRYYLRVQSAVCSGTPITCTPQTNNSRGSNGYALRAWTGNSYSTCSTIASATNYNANCPQLHAVSDMSIYANINGTTASFYLAQIDAIHAGKTMRINLFDTGEGADTVQIFGPDNVAKSFNWSTPCSPQTPPQGGVCSGTTTSLDVSDTACPIVSGKHSCPQPYSTVNSKSKFSDRYLTLDIPLPNNYNGSAGNYWWKIKYTVAACDPQHHPELCPTDRTTWSVNIVGDPVHLLQ